MVRQSHTVIEMQCFCYIYRLSEKEMSVYWNSFLPVFSGEVYPGWQSWFCEGPVHLLHVQGSRAAGQQAPAGEPAQIHARPLIIRS